MKKTYTGANRGAARPGLALLFPLWPWQAHGLYVCVASAAGVGHKVFDLNPIGVFELGIIMPNTGYQVC